MCGIDPLMCWYYDYQEYWSKHPDEMALAKKVMEAGFRGCGVFVNNYALMGIRLSKIDKFVE